MSGLVGFTASLDRQQDRRTLAAMRQLITHLDFSGAYGQTNVHYLMIALDKQLSPVWSFTGQAG